MGFDRLNFKDVAMDCLCSICKGVFENPVQLEECQHIYCRECIQKWTTFSRDMGNGLLCPADEMPMSDLVAIPFELKSKLDCLVIDCKNKSNGCDIKVRLDQYDDHLLDCEHYKDIDNSGSGDLDCDNKLVQDLPDPHTPADMMYFFQHGHFPVDMK